MTPKVSPLLRYTCPISTVRKFARPLNEQSRASPVLTWIYHHLAIRYAPEWDRPEVAEEVRTWASRLVTWDPENAAPFLLQSELIRRQRGSSWLQGQATDSTFLDRLMRETEWRTTMKTAFSRARYDLYAVSRFELERQVLRQQG